MKLRITIVALLLIGCLFLYSELQDYKISNEFNLNRYNKNEQELNVLLDNLTECNDGLKELNKELANINR